MMEYRRDATCCYRRQHDGKPIAGCKLLAGERREESTGHSGENQRHGANEGMMSSSPRASRPIGEEAEMASCWTNRRQRFASHNDGAT
jgi:hypothetical protein